MIRAKLDKMQRPFPHRRTSVAGHHQHSEYGLLRQAATERNEASFSSNVKHCFKLIQTTHHCEVLNNVGENNILPPGMQRQLFKLSSFVKPACPSLNTTEKVQAATVRWMSQILSILMEHYNNLTASLVASAPTWDTDAFNKAISWAKSRYRRKLTDSSLELAKTWLMGANWEPPRRELGTEVEQQMKSFSIRLYCRF